MDADETNLRQITDNHADDRAPMWSPDRRRLAFVSDRDGDDEVFVMYIDGSNLWHLTHNSTSDRGPVWSSDGFPIAFTGQGDGDE